MTLSFKSIQCLERYFANAAVQTEEVQTYSRRGCPGAGGRTERAELWTEPTWRCPEPATQNGSNGSNQSFY